MSDLPWLADANSRLDARLRRGQLPQALLIHGPSGVGRRHFALGVAARLLGSPWRPGIDTVLDPLEAVPHPDYWHLGPEEDSREIKVDQVRALIRTLALTSHDSGRKVGLVWPADQLNHYAANTLLKTLEEPPAGTTLILVAGSSARLPATIVSRCEQVRLPTPPASVSLAWLSQLHPDRADCERALAFASGGPLMALALLREDKSGGTAGILVELAGELQQLVDRKAPPTTIAKAWAKRDAGVCLRWLFLQTAALLRRTAGVAEDPTSRAFPLKIHEGTVNMAACCAYLDQVLEAQRLKDRSLNMEVMFADLLMWWYGAAGAVR